MKIISIIQRYLGITILGLFISPLGFAQSPVSSEEAASSMAKARVKCQTLTYDAASCMNAISDAKYVDAELMTLCLKRSYEKMECLQKGKDKLYTEEELGVCAKRSYEFLGCIASLGTQVTIRDREANYCLQFRRQVGLARVYMEEARYHESYKTILEIERSFDSHD
jgi:hypothetical protein